MPTARPILIPLTIAEANDFVASFHRHNQPLPGARFAIGASDGHQLVGAVLVGRPTARAQQDGLTSEVTRCCVRENAPKGTCSMLYAASWRAWKAMGGTRLITYTLQSESGASPKGAGFRLIAQLPANKPTMWQSRPGRDWQPVVGQAKFRWELATA
jgi:hypothetical protein